MTDLLEARRAATIADMQPPRAAWNEFPDVLIHASESAVTKHPRYQAAKSGDAEAAVRLVEETIDPAQVAKLRAFLGGRKATLVDDFVGMGGTLANLKGYIESKGGRALAAVTLTGKPYSARLRPEPDQLSKLRAKHGQDLDDFWRERFGHGFDALTQSEARYLSRSPDADTIRNRLAEKEPARDRGLREEDPESGVTDVGPV
ncbi:MAG: phosphoribosyltransferase [Gammaproteobacteria bacterium]